MDVTIRPAHPDELSEIVGIEAAADESFASFDPPEPLEHGELVDYQPACDDGRVLVAVADGHIAGFVRIEYMDAHPHVEQVSVHPSYAGRHIGASLMAAAEQWALDNGHHTMTLTTFSNIPWNAPYYERLGWATLADADQGPELRARRIAEAPLEFWPRQAMIKRV